MQRLSIFMNVLALIMVLGVTAAAQSQSTRTFVSGIGSDFNPCTRTAPCQTFTAALAMTAVNGEINCLDPGGFGAVTIAKSVTIDCEDQQGSILTTSAAAVQIDLGPFSSSDPKRFVRLRGLSINGSGLISGQYTRSGSRGIIVTAGNTAPTTVHVEQVVIDNFALEGILFNGAGGELVVRNSIIQNSGTIGVMVDSNNANALVHAKFENSSFLHNQQGIRAETAARITASNCNISNNSLNGVVAFTSDATQAQINLYNCLIASNRQFGVIAGTGTGPAIIRLDGNHIVNNFGVAGAAGVQIISGGQVLSRGNNTISGNTIDVQGGTLGSIAGQ